MRIPSLAGSVVPGTLSAAPWCKAMTRHFSSNTGLPELPGSVGER